MLVQEYLGMVAELRGIAEANRRAAIARAIRATGLEAWLVRPIATLSKGYRQRVGLAQAILHAPEVLVLDEPTSGLDPVQIAEIRTLIRGLAATSTVILSTHILSEIEAVCDRVVILIDGSLAADSKLADLLSSNEVRLSLDSAATGVEATLAAVGNVESVVRVGPDPARAGYELWKLSCSSAPPPTPEIVRAAASAGWNVASIGAATQNLEQVFRELIVTHTSATRSGVTR
jgi:ABC-2 type transport system ATP-binding protein